MNVQTKPKCEECPVSSEAVANEAKVAFDDLVSFCRTSELPFGKFESALLVRMAVLGCCWIRLFLTARHERIQVASYLEDGGYRRGDPYAQRTLKTAYGVVTYGRQYLQSQRRGNGIFPLDIELGLTWDSLSPWVMQLVARLATRMSFKASKMVCEAVLNWAPATETIEQVVLGMGRDASAFMAQAQVSSKKSPDGEVLVIEVDGKCPPTATEAELSKRRGQRQPRHEKDCTCGCQRHRGKAKRRARGPRKRRKKGDKSKNGKEVIVVVMYTLKRGEDGKLHGPLNKKLYATFAGSLAGALWARAEATRRGFSPETSRTVQVVHDGAQRLHKAFQAQFPKAIFTLDVFHAIEYLWSVGREYYKEGSDELRAFVDALKELLYAGKIRALLKRFRKLLDEVSPNGPGTKGKRTKLKRVLGYFGRRVKLMSYGKWFKADLVIATGQAEGAVRHLVGERFDCAGMRWVKGKAEALLHLRCIELNGDWESFVDWFQQKNRAHLKSRERRRILTDQPIILKKAA